MFLFIGAEPNTDWLRGSGTELVRNGFVRAGGTLTVSGPLLGCQA